MTKFIFWPEKLLVPFEIQANPVAFSRSGGRSLSGLKRTVRTDRGYWEIEMTNIPIFSRAQRRTWNAIRTDLGGTSGLAVIPVWSKDTAPYYQDDEIQTEYTTHSDGSFHSDDTPYQQQSIDAYSFDEVPIGATQMRIRASRSSLDMSGVRFSYAHALYETGSYRAEPAGANKNIFTVRIFPAVRAVIPEGAKLNFNMPTCLVNLKEDRGMDISYNPTGFTQRSVVWQEAAQYWSDLAAGLIE